MGTSMKLNALVKFMLVASTVVVATACGGGSDDESGSLTPFAVFPNEFAVTGGAGCTALADVVRITVEGGTAPYRIERHSSAVMTDVNSVSNNGSFVVSFTGTGCFEGNMITVFDAQGRAAPVSMTTRRLRPSGEHL